MSMQDILESQRAALVAERDALTADPEKFDTTAEARADEITGTIKTIDERTTALHDEETRQAAAAEARKVTHVEVVNEPNPVYRKDANVSFFMDVARSKNGDFEARDRLVKSQETRALTTVAGAGGQFAPPEWLIADYIALARPARVTADLANKMTLPSGVSSINLPKVATGATVGVTTTQNTQISNTDITTASVSSSVTTISGQQIIALQLLEQSGIPFDQVILKDLALAYAGQLDTQVISGSGAAGQLRGLTSVATTTAFTSGSPAPFSATAANSFYSKINGAKVAVSTGRFLPADSIVMSPARWGWLENGGDGNGRPLVVPNGQSFNQIAVAGAESAQGFAGTMLGLPVYLDPNLPANLGAGTNQDEVFVLRRDDLWLWESALQSASFDATYANQNSILFRVLGYAAFIPDRYSASVQVIAGTGLVQPTF
jgi:HK97 family phage major capsid protein